MASKVVELILTHREGFAMSKKITLPRLRSLIAEELKSNIQEGVDHASIREVVNGASKLLAAVETFKEVANGPMTNALTPHLDAMAKALEDMVSSPGSYVEKKKAEPQKVSLKPVKPVVLKTYTSTYKVII